MTLRPVENKRALPDISQGLTDGIGREVANEIRRNIPMGWLRHRDAEGGDAFRGRREVERFATRP